MRPSLRPYLMNRRWWVVNQDGLGVADFKSKEDALRYIAVVQARRILLDRATRGALA